MQELTSVDHAATWRIHKTLTKQQQPYTIIHIHREPKTPSSSC